MFPRTKIKLRHGCQAELPIVAAVFIERRFFRPVGIGIRRSPLPRHELRFLRRISVQSDARVREVSGAGPRRGISERPDCAFVLAGLIVRRNKQEDLFSPEGREKSTQKLYLKSGARKCSKIVTLDLQKKSTDCIAFSH